MEKNDIWDLEVEGNIGPELTEEDKRLVSIYSEHDMLSRDILPILEDSVDDYKEEN